MKAFDLKEAEAIITERVESLVRDTKRCLDPAGQPAGGSAFFPAVLYAFATIDFLSSCITGWNDRKSAPTNHQPAECQTPRMEGFLTDTCGYGKIESKIAVAIWRHKLMHTGEPRTLRNKKNGDRYHWCRPSD